MRIALPVLASALFLTACNASAPAPAAAPPAFNAEDPAVIAVLDSMVSLARAGADAVNADETMRPLNAEDNVTFMTGDVLIAGKEEILKAFRVTYAQIKALRHVPVARRVRLLTPDVAPCTAVAKDAYQDLAVESSKPVGLGTAAVFIKRDATWRLVHFHQSVAR